MKKILSLMLNPAFDMTVTAENFRVGATNRVASKIKQPAGKGFNAGTVARRFYPAVSLLAFCPTPDRIAFAEAAQAAQLDSSFVEVGGSVRTNLKIVDPLASVTTELNEKGFSVTEHDLDAMLTCFCEQLADSAAVIITGSLPEGVPKDFYKTCIQLANEKQVKVILDAEGAAFSLGVSAAPFAVKPNLSELEQFAGRRLSSDEAIIDAMKAIQAGGVSLVVASLGERGAFFMNQEELIFAPSPKVLVKSTVGAGDSMAAVLAWGAVEDIPLSQLARFATAAGSVTASKAGTELCKYEEVQDISREVAIRHVKKD